MRIVPEKTDARAHDRRAEYRELARAAEVEHLEIRRRVDAADHVCEKRQRQYGDRRETGRKAVETIGDVHRVARAGENERDEQYVEPRERRLNQYVLVERQSSGRAGQC